jgi:hypothetical protein
MKAMIFHRSKARRYGPFCKRDTNESHPDSCLDSWPIDPSFSCEWPIPTPLDFRSLLSRAHGQKNQAADNGRYADDRGQRNGLLVFATGVVQDCFFSGVGDAVIRHGNDPEHDQDHSDYTDGS